MPAARTCPVSLALGCFEETDTLHMSHRSWMLLILRAACASRRGGCWGIWHQIPIQSEMDPAGGPSTWDEWALARFCFCSFWSVSLQPGAPGCRWPCCFLPQQQPPLISQRTRWKAGGVGRSFFCPILICNCKAVIFQSQFRQTGSHL